MSADNFEVSAGDYIGWVNEDNNTWISADQCIMTDPCQCSRLYDFRTTYNWPVVNETSTFECRPYNFSVAVEIHVTCMLHLSHLYVNYRIETEVISRYILLLQVLCTE